MQILVWLFAETEMLGDGSQLGDRDAYRR
jgi:hypothetical protein